MYETTEQNVIACIRRAGEAGFDRFGFLDSKLLAGVYVN